MDHTIQVIAKIHSDFCTKFGIPRQSGLVDALRSTVVFEPEFRSPEAVRGLEDFSHIWLLWQFSQAVQDSWSPTVRPPRLGGNRRLGVFATRSPFRPNSIGLSAVRLVGVEPDGRDGPLLHVAALPALCPGRRWRWTARPSCWRLCRRRNALPFWACWRRIPDPPIRTTPSGSTACLSPV